MVWNIGKMRIEDRRAREIMSGLSEVLTSFGYETNYRLPGISEEGLFAVDSSCLQCGVGSNMSYKLEDESLIIRTSPERLAQLESRREDILKAIQRKFPVRKLELALFPGS